MARDRTRRPRSPTRSPGADRSIELDADLILPASLEAAVRSGHPWIYRDHISPDFSAKSGQLLRLRAGHWAGYGLWDEHSSVAIRVLSARARPDSSWLARQVQRAWRLREALLADGTTAFRWINGEGDGLPGVVVDLYDRWAVVATYAAAVETLLPGLGDALGKCQELSGILHRRADAPRDAQDSVGLFWGEAPPKDLVVAESSMKLYVDLFQGHKTGLYLDHRENRKTLVPLYRGASVLNLYAYTGSFSVLAALHGARRVVSVDQAALALHWAQRNVELNGLSLAGHEFVKDDAFEYMQRSVAQQLTFDLVICDPPSMAHNSAQLGRALSAYRRLASYALRLVRPEGYLAIASCTAKVTPEAFREAIAEAATRVGRRVQIVHEAGHAPDHPVLANHREGRYLKFLLARVLPAE